MTSQRYCLRSMTRPETQVLLLCKGVFCTTVDPVGLSSQLYKSRYICQKLYDEILAMFIENHPRYYISEQLLSSLPHQTDLFSVIQALNSCGYYSLAKTLLQHLIEIQRGITYVSKTHQNRDSLHKYYRRLTVGLSDAQFNNPKGDLRNLAKRTISMFNGERDPLKKQYLADKCVTILAVEVDAHAITSDSDLCRSELFNEFRLIIPYTNNTLVSDIMYFARLATAFTLAKDFERGEEMLNAAKTSAYNTGQCFELTTLISIEVCFRLRQYEITPTQELKDHIMMLGRTGLELLEFEENDTKLMWQRIFILRMVFCLLGIGKLTNLIVDCVVDCGCIKMAEELLAKVDESFQGVDQRREMFYCVAKARLFQCRGDLKEAILYIRKAEKLALSGCFTEAKFILNLKQYLQDINNDEFVPNTANTVDEHLTVGKLQWQPTASNYPEYPCENSPVFHSDLRSSVGVHDTFDMEETQEPVDTSDIVETHLKEPFDMEETHLKEPFDMEKTHLKEPFYSSDMVEMHLKEPFDMEETHLKEPFDMEKTHLKEPFYSSDMVETHLKESFDMEETHLKEPFDMEKTHLKEPFYSSDMDETHLKEPFDMEKTHLKEPFDTFDVVVMHLKEPFDMEKTHLKEPFDTFDVVVMHLKEPFDMEETHLKEPFDTRWS